MLEGNLQGMLMGKLVCRELRNVLLGMPVRKEPHSVVRMPVGMMEDSKVKGSMPVGNKLGMDCKVVDMGMVQGKGMFVGSKADYSKQAHNSYLLNSQRQ